MSVDSTPTEVSAEFWASLPRKRVGAGLVIVDDASRVLPVEPTYKPGWEVPGGMVEAGESPRSAARRESLEELGVEVQLGRLLVMDWRPPGRRPDDGLMLLYECGSFDVTTIVLQDEELRSWRWCDPAEVRARTTPFMAAVWTPRSPRSRTGPRWSSRTAPRSRGPDRERGRRSVC